MRRAAGAALLMALLAGCGREPVPAATAPAQIGGASGTELADLQILRKGNAAEPESLDPHRARSLPAANILRDLFEGLTLEAPDGTIVPGAAERWDVTADGLTYTFHLRPGGRWSNGDPVTARDFEFGLRRSCDPATLNEYASILYPIVNATEVNEGRMPITALGVHALDDSTLEIRLNGPDAVFLRAPRPQRQLTRCTAGPSSGSATSSSGRATRSAMAPTVWRSGSCSRTSASLRNPYYWNDARTVINEVWYYPIENHDSELNRYRAGELDFTEAVPFSQVRWLRQNLPRDLRIAPYLGSYYFSFNNTMPPFRDNVKLRMALSLAIDREILTGRVMGSGEIAAYGFVPPVANYTGQRPPWADWSQAERNAEAQRLYREAGYSDDNPLVVEVLYNTDQNHKRIAGAMAAMWKQTLGVQAKLLNQEWKVFLASRSQKVVTQVFRGAWIGDYNDAYTFAQLMHSSNAQNDPGYRQRRIRRAARPGGRGGGSGETTAADGGRGAAAARRHADHPVVLLRLEATGETLGRRLHAEHHGSPPHQGLPHPQALMLRFTLQRLLTGIPTLLTLVAIAFFLIRAAPGGPFDSERKLPPDIEANVRSAYHLDEPVLRQFGRYLRNLAMGDFGPSFKYREFTVTELIRTGFPVSLRLGALAMLLAVLIGDLGRRLRGPAPEQGVRSRGHGGGHDRALRADFRGGAHCSYWRWPYGRAGCRLAVTAPASGGTWCCRSSRSRCPRSPIWRD